MIMKTGLCFYMRIRMLIPLNILVFSFLVCEAQDVSNKTTVKEGELLYNGIKLPAVWPPSNISPDNFGPIPVPYLQTPPEVIPIDLGRQLWVDDFLIKETNLKREFHKAVKFEGNPVLKAEKEWEKSRDG